MKNADKTGGLRKERIRRELFEYGLNVLYLTIVFAAFTWYQRLVQGAQGIVYTNYGIALIEALILGKVIMLGGIFRLGRGLEERPLIYSTLYKTFVFALFVALFKLIEHAIKGLLMGEGIAGGLAKYTGKGIHVLFDNRLVVFVALLPFFAIKEMGRVLGSDKISTLFFRRREVEPRNGI